MRVTLPLKKDSPQVTNSHNHGSPASFELSDKRYSFFYIEILLPSKKVVKKNFFLFFRRYFIAE